MSRWKNVTVRFLVENTRSLLLIEDQKSRWPTFLGRLYSGDLAHWLIVATAVCLPWSTSAVSILLAAWAFIILPKLDWRNFWQEILDPVGGLPVLLVLLAVLGTFWAAASPLERWQGLSAFFRLLAIPLLITQFRRSGRGADVFTGFLISCFALLAASYVVYVFPALGKAELGVPVKNYITQSIEFAICAAILADRCFDRAYSRSLRIIFSVGTVAFLMNILFIATGRTTLFIIAALVVMYGFRKGGLKGATAGVILLLLGSIASWESSSYLRQRVLSVNTEIHLAEKSNIPASSGLRLIFWEKALRFLKTSPIYGNGTGSIPEMYRKAAIGQSGADALDPTNPHNQTLTIGIQLGGIGIGLLWAMWICQLRAFRRPGIWMWIGTVFVIQNIVGSFFNSLLFDFTEGWIYIIGVGVALGMTRHKDHIEVRAVENEIHRGP